MINWLSVRPVHTGNKLLPKTATIVAENGNKSATNCCRFWQQFVAVSGNNLLPKMATKLYCPHWQQFVADFGNNLLPKSATNCCQWPVWTGLNVAAVEVMTYRRHVYKTTYGAGRLFRCLSKSTCSCRA